MGNSSKIRPGVLHSKMEFADRVQPNGCIIILSPVLDLQEKYAGKTFAALIAVPYLCNETGDWCCVSVLMQDQC